MLDLALRELRKEMRWKWLDRKSSRWNGLFVAACEVCWASTTGTCACWETWMKKCVSCVRIFGGNGDRKSSRWNGSTVLVAASEVCWGSMVEPWTLRSSFFVAELSYIIRTYVGVDFKSLQVEMQFCSGRAVAGHILRFKWLDKSLKCCFCSGRLVARDTMMLIMALCHPE